MRAKITTSNKLAGRGAATLLTAVFYILSPPQATSAKICDMDMIKKIVRKQAHGIALWLHRASNGRLRPNHITIIGLLMHLPIAWLIAMQHNVWAAILLVIFGLFDVLDGELARVQHRASPQGMLLDASTDRMKETLIYCGAGYALAMSAAPETAVWAVAACGASICVSYVRAKGEAVIAARAGGIDHATLNNMHRDGLLTFEVRMAIIVAALLCNQLLVAVAIVAVLAGVTAVQRLSRISKALGNA